MRITNTNSTSVKPALRWHWLWLGLGLLSVQLLTALCLVPVPIRLAFPMEDKLLHLAAHTLPAWWFFMLYRAAFERRALLAVFLCLAILDEALQQLTPYHTVEAADALANVAGILLGRWLADTRLGGLLLWLERWV